MRGQVLAIGLIMASGIGVLIMGLATVEALDETLWESRDIMRVPVSALFRDGDQWAVFAEEQGRGVRWKVPLGHQNGTHAQIVGGLDLGGRIVLHPNGRIADGVRIVARARQ